MGIRVIDRVSSAMSTNSVAVGKRLRVTGKIEGDGKQRLDLWLLGLLHPNARGSGGRQRLQDMW